MDLPEYSAPLAALLAFGALSAYASWRAARPADPLKPRMLPWRGLSLFAGVAAFIALVLLLTRLGVKIPGAA